MDSVKASQVSLKDSLPTQKGELVCGEMPAHTLWAGTASGWLEIPYPCSGRSNHTIQLRSGNSIAAEHQGKTEDPMIWKIRNSEIALKDTAYQSRLYFYGLDGKTLEVRSPTVKIDSLNPVFVNDIELAVKERGTNRIIQVEANVHDEGSGIAKTQLDLYFGENLLQTKTIFADSVFFETFSIDRKTLYDCVGCKARITITTEDYGHNYVKASLETAPLYPYPASLVLWYPLEEGVGAKAVDVTGSGLDLNLNTINKPWRDENKLHLSGSDFATSDIEMVQCDSAMPFSLEMKVSAGFTLGSIFSWNGENSWTVGINAARNYYIDTRNGRTLFATKASLIAMDHIVFAIENNQVQLFKNGELKETKNVNDTLVWIGGGKPIVGRHLENAMTGFVSDIRLYTTILSLEQVAALYKDNLDLDDGSVFATRATDLAYSDLTIDQSCGVPGKSYLRQKSPANSLGRMEWNVSVEADSYNAFLLMMNNTSENSKVEVFVNGVSKGVFEMKSTGFWGSQKIENLTFTLPAGTNTISIRPIGNVGVAGIALISSKKSIEAHQVNYGEGSWKSPEPQIAVKMMYENTGDVSWMRAKMQLTNLTAKNISGAKVRYYYKGEGEQVQAYSFYPMSPMRVVSDGGNIYYGELTLTEDIPSWGSVYYGNGPQIGLHRTDYYFPWNIFDDPSYALNAENSYVDGTGIAVLDEDGVLLNDWSCFDSEGPLVNAQKSVIAYAKDLQYGSNQSSNITAYVENDGSVAIDGFELRYYFRNGEIENEIEIYNNPFASQSVVAAGGNLNYVSFIYNDVILNPGEKSDFGGGVQFAMHLPNWAVNFDASDDPSNYGLNEDSFVPADSVLVLDLNGNLLWGSVPQPSFRAEYLQKEIYDDLIHVEGEIIIVNAPENAHYILETVNAAGMPLVQLFNGTLNEGEHIISTENKTFNPGSYLVLRKGAEILSWKLFK